MRAWLCRIYSAHNDEEELFSTMHNRTEARLSSASGIEMLSRLVLTWPYLAREQRKYYGAVLCNSFQLGPSPL